MKIYTIYPWEGREDVRLTAFINVPGPREPEDNLRPALIVMPGGAYRSVSKDAAEGDNAAMNFACEGYQTFVLEYTVGSAAQFPSQIMDYAASVRVIRDHAEEWNIDVDRIAIMGFSAGAHLAAMIATAWHVPQFSEDVGLVPEDLKPLCAILMYGMYDFQLQEEYRKKIGGDPTMNLNVFGTEEPPENILIAFSPVRLVSDKTCPIFMVAARDDTVVPSIHSIKMAAALTEKSVPYELHMFEKGDHLFATGQYRDQPWRTDRKYTAAAWLDLAKKFLLRHAEPDSAEWDNVPLGKIKRPRDR